MNSTFVYPAYALVAMAREANRALVHALRVNSAPLAVIAARRRAKYMALARGAQERAALISDLCQIVDAAISNHWDLAQFQLQTSRAVAAALASKHAKFHREIGAVVGAEA